MMRPSSSSTRRSMVVAGVMSGTSADGVDVALCRIGPRVADFAMPRVRLLGLVSRPYPSALRRQVLRLMEGEPATAAEISRLNWRLGETYADVVVQAAKHLGYTPALVGMHGQTIHHEAAAPRAPGRTVRSTWQLGEAAVVAERLRCPVVGDLRPADLAAGGQGAPLVPMLDACLFRSDRVSRVLQNLGGIGNLTAIPAGGAVESLLAFDTGPGNMVIDLCMATLFGKTFDRGGAVAARGAVRPDVIASVLREAFFRAPPPKSCGREEFGARFGARFVSLCRSRAASDADVVATATALTAESVVQAYRSFVRPHLAGAAPRAKVEFCVAGGGAKNRTLMAMLAERFAPLGVRVRQMEELGMPAQAKEAVAFALLAWLTWHGLPGNLPSATGAARAVVLGKLSHG
ncbi:MAG: anhydro-N-acetylmuramic acid kinase [Acidobacteriota bacterium]|nr:anhydro-N-acetylmuramic acid kinase [Acidobacteriota bacterium]